MTLRNCGFKSIFPCQFAIIQDHNLKSRTNSVLEIRKMGNERRNTGNRYRSYYRSDCGINTTADSELIEKSFAENTVRNRRQALKHFDEWLNGRPCSDGLPRTVYHTPV